jgi:hypothetical protein
MLKRVVDFKDSKLFYLTRSTFRFLIIENTITNAIRAFPIPKELNIEVVGVDRLQISLITDSVCAHEMSNFIDKLPHSSKNTDLALYKAKLLLKGVGYRASLSNLNKNLVLKLGYSNPIVLDLGALDCQVKIQKNALLFTCYDKTKLGNVIAKLRRLRTADVYKGKGLWGRYDNISLKQVKKK